MIHHHPYGFVHAEHAARVRDAELRGHVRAELRLRRGRHRPTSLSYPTSRPRRRIVLTTAVRLLLAILAAAPTALLVDVARS